MLRLASRRVVRSDAQYVCLSCLLRRFKGPIRYSSRHQTRAVEVKDAVAGEGLAKRSQTKKENCKTDIKHRRLICSSKSLPQSAKDQPDPPGKPTKKRIRRLRGASSSKASKRSRASKKASNDPIEIKKHPSDLRVQIKKVINPLVRKYDSSGKDPLSTAEFENTIQQPKSKPTKVGKANGDVCTVDAATLVIRPVEADQPPVPALSYGLERVLFNPGVYHLQDPRSRVYNFDPYLQKIMPVAEFDFNALKQYITSSRDESLQTIAQKHGKKYVGSTSSMTGVLAHFHFLLSQWREIDTSTLSQGFPDKLRSFTQLQRCPSAIFLRKREGCYAIDADKEFDTASILSMLGKSMEKFLTLSSNSYERYRKSSPGSVSEDERNSPEAFHYSTMGDFLMRSQLDAHDSRLPGTGMFDLKTRAIVSVRMDAKNYMDGKDYEIRSRHGEWESFEREYFDMIRSAFLKYSLQVRMGRMDGIFVAFHNTERIFGFQYISLPEMDSTLHGQWDTTLGDQEFKLSLELLNKCLDRASQKFPDKSLRIHIETRETRSNFMYVFAEPVTEEQVEKIQTNNQENIRNFERSVLGLHGDDGTVDTGQADEAPAKKEWAEVAPESENDEMSPQDNDVMQNSNTMFEGKSVAKKHDDAVPVNPIRDGNEQAEQRLISDARIREHSVQSTLLINDSVLDESGDPTAASENNNEKPQDEILIQKAKSTKEDAGLQETLPNPLEVASDANDNNAILVEAGDSETPGDTQFLDGIDDEQASVIPEGSEGSLLAMTVTIRNKVNGKYVLRPSELAADDKWSLEYSIDEVPSESRAWSLYGACQARRKSKLEFTESTEDDMAASYYLRKMRELSQKGKIWRTEQDNIDKRSKKVVFGQSSPSSIVKESQVTSNEMD